MIIKKLYSIIAELRSTIKGLHIIIEELRSELAGVRKDQEEDRQRAEAQLAHQTKLERDLVEARAALVLAGKLHLAGEADKLPDVLLRGDAAHVAQEWWREETEDRDARIELLAAGIVHLECAMHAGVVATEEEWGAMTQWIDDARADALETP